MDMGYVMYLEERITKAEAAHNTNEAQRLRRILTKEKRAQEANSHFAPLLNRVRMVGGV